MGAGALGWALGAGLGVQARRQQAWQQALGRAGTAWACADGRAGKAWACADGRAGRGRRGADARGRAAGKAWTRGGARQALASGAGERAAGRGRQARGARGARRGRAGRGLGVPGRAWCTGWASLGLMQPVWVLTWVFDSVVSLGHRLDSVHEHCSLQNFFRKKKKDFKFK